MNEYEADLSNADKKIKLLEKTLKSNDAMIIKLDKSVNSQIAKNVKLELQVTKVEPLMKANLKLSREALFSDSLTVSTDSAFRDLSNTDLCHHLFTNVDYTPQDIRYKISEFHGAHIILSEKKYKKRKPHQNQYLVHMGGEHYLDCTKNALSGVCRASKCNDPRNLFLKVCPKIEAKNNVEIFRDFVNFRAWLVVKDPLKAGSELFLSYGSKFSIDKCVDYVDTGVF